MIKDIIMPFLISLLFATCVHLLARVYELHARLDNLDDLLVVLANTIGST